ncbi:MAG TPA: stage II sporulation protein R [Clostridiales bacterium]|nr:stage II sporulation protein R [Clostridiales bacterium]
MKNAKILRIELAVLIGLIVCILVSVFAQQHGLAKGLIRLHISAASDESGDQAVKLAVRDRLLTDFFEVVPVPETTEEARRLLSAALPILTALAEDELNRQGRPDLTVTATLETEVFPERHYDDFSLPAGEYTTLRLRLGEGKGANWWCVMYPPLCAPSSMSNVSNRKIAEQAGLMRGKTAEVKIKFKILEWFYSLKARLT